MQVAEENIRVAAKKRVWSKPTTVAEFEIWESKKQYEHNHEFYYGEIIVKSGTRQDDIFLVRHLSRTFTKTKAYKAGGFLAGHCDVYIDDFRKRVPLFSFFTNPQMRDAVVNGEKVVPAFVIELVSEKETFYKVLSKVQDYFDAGVKLVWFIIPKTKRIYHY
jgi:Uma2 family endonuclease